MNREINEFSENVAAQDKPLLDVLVMYEDLHTGKRAKTVLDWLAKRFGMEFKVAMKLWRFDHLTLPWLREQAAIEAAQADVVILSVDKKTKLSALEREWADCWREQKENRPGLLCVLQEPGESDAENPLIAEMQDFASAAGMDFFSGAFDATSTGTNGSFDRLHERANHISNVLDEILQHDLDQRGHKSRAYGG